MKWYMFMLCLLVGFVWSANAQQIDPQLVGTWESTDGPCTPCALTIHPNGTVDFALGGSAVQVVFSQGTPGPGIDLVFPLGGKADLTLSTNGKLLIGFYTNPRAAQRYVPVAFQRK